MTEAHHWVTKEWILQENADVFSGLGCFPEEYDIEVDESVVPVNSRPIQANTTYYESSSRGQVGGAGVGRNYSTS